MAPGNPGRRYKEAYARMFGAHHSSHDADPARGSPGYYRPSYASDGECCTGMGTGDTMGPGSGPGGGRRMVGAHKKWPPADDFTKDGMPNDDMYNPRRPKKVGERVSSPGDWYAS